MTGKVGEAAALTNRIFSCIKHEDYVFKGMPLAWSIYSVIYYQYALKYKLGEPGHELLRSLKRERLRDFYKIFTSDILKNIISCITIIILLFDKRKRSALWSGDFYSNVNNGDFRLGDLYSSMDKEGLSYVEFIRDSEFGLQKTLFNFFRRRRLVIYYSPFLRLLRAFSRQSYISIDLNCLEENYQIRDILHAASYQMTNSRQIRLFTFLFRLLGIRSLIAWEFMERQAALIYAANLEKIDAIGFMHGAGMNSYMPHEFMSSMKTAPDRFGLTVMGVWSSWWKSYFESNSNFYREYEIICPLKEKIDFRSQLDKYVNREKKAGLLWVCEPLVSPSELIEFIDIASEIFEIKFKIRQGARNNFYEELIDLRPELRDKEILDGDMFEAISNCELVVGSHSTAVLDASLLNTKFFLVNTKKWGNYFELGDNYFSITPDDFRSKLQSLPEQNLGSMKERWFGVGNMSGVDFVVSRVKSSFKDSG